MRTPITVKQLMDVLRELDPDQPVHFNIRCGTRGKTVARVTIPYHENSIGLAINQHGVNLHLPAGMYTVCPKKVKRQ